LAAVSAISFWTDLAFAQLEVEKTVSSWQGSVPRENVPAIVENAVGGMAAGLTGSAVKENKPQPPNA
jgi:hypothetical protein